MCGIAGKVSLGAPVEEALLEGMCSAIEHRGPDSRGVFLDEGIGLGIQRLRIIDLETGDQPIYNEDRSVVLVLNGEIYNYRELRADLEARGHHFTTRTDTEVIVHLYEELGDACVKRLRGMFAFALWDRRERRLLLARDRIGKKPLFYAEHAGQLWFASEAKAILADPEVPRDVDHAAIDSFLQLSYVPHPRSAFRALRKVPPAHTLVWADGRAKTERYWQLVYSRKDPVLDTAELHERIRAALLEATRLRLRSDVPVGAFLSGGVDSTAVVAAMARESSDPVKTFAIGFSSAAFDETAYAREVSGLFGTEHHELRVEPHAVDVLPRLVWHYGEPFADTSAIPTFYLSELTREHVTVALNGDGGDESFAGYSRYWAHEVARRAGWVPKPAVRLAGRLLDCGGARRSRFRPLRSAWWLSKTVPLAPDHQYRRTMSCFQGEQLADVYTPEFMETLAPDQVSALIEDPFARSDADSLVERLMDVDVHSYLPDDLLVKVDIASMAHSLEVRSPLLDHVFMETAAAIPARLKLARGTTKQVFKDALRPWVPDRVLDRPKKGFSAPMSEWLRGELRNIPAEVLLDARAVNRGIFRPDAVRSLIDRHLSGVEDNACQLWALIQLETWFQTFIDERRTAPLALAFKTPA